MKPSFDLHEDVSAASLIMTFTLFASDNQLISLVFISKSGNYDFFCSFIYNIITAIFT